MELAEGKPCVFHRALDVVPDWKRALEQLISLGRAFTASADLLLGKDILTETPEGDLRFEFKDLESDLLNAVTNQVFQFAARRYFDNEYDSYAVDRHARIEDYVSVTQGILFTAKSVSLKQALVNVKRDENGLPKYLEGEITLNLKTAGKGDRKLDISFQMNVKDLGKTKVKRFDPKEYDVISEREMAQGEPMYIDESDLNATERAALRALAWARFPTAWVTPRSASSAAHSGLPGPRIRMGRRMPPSRSWAASSGVATAR